jgi:hypothetical protein
MTPAPSFKRAKLDYGTSNVLANLGAFSWIHELSVKCAYGRLILKLHRGRIISSNFRESSDWGPFGKNEEDLTENVRFNLDRMHWLYTLMTDPDCAGCTGVVMRFRDGRIVYEECDFQT